ncbi:MAG: DinB family protein [Anaerolineae bacterium]
MNDLVERLERNRDEFLTTAARLTDDVADVSLGEDDWTLWGVTAHLTASEWQLRRLAEIIAENPSFQFEPYDLDEINARNVARYEGQSIPEILKQWKSNRQTTIEFAANLSPEQLKNSVLHPNYGEINPHYPIERSLWHTTLHLAQIKAALRQAGQ